MSTLLVTSLQLRSRCDSRRATTWLYATALLCLSWQRIHASHSYSRNGGYHGWTRPGNNALVLCMRTLVLYVHKIYSIHTCQILGNVLLKWGIFNPWMRVLNAVLVLGWHVIQSRVYGFLPRRNTQVENKENLWRVKLTACVLFASISTPMWHLICFGKIFFFFYSLLYGAVSSFKATLYPCPESADERREMSLGVLARLADLETVRATRTQSLSRTLMYCAVAIERIRHNVFANSIFFFVVDQWWRDVTDVFELLTAGVDQIKRTKRTSAAVSG